VGVGQKACFAVLLKLAVLFLATKEGRPWATPSRNEPLLRGEGSSPMLLRDIQSMSAGYSSHTSHGSRLSAQLQVHIMEAEAVLLGWTCLQSSYKQPSLPLPHLSFLDKAGD